MRLTGSAHDDYTRFQSSVVQRALKPSVKQLAFREDRDVMMCYGRGSQPQNGLTVIRSSDKNCSVQPANCIAAHAHVAEKTSDSVMSS